MEILRLTEIKDGVISVVICNACGVVVAQDTGKPEDIPIIVGG